METTQANQFVSEIFDTFVAVCTKYKIDFSVAKSDNKAIALKPVVGVDPAKPGTENTAVTVAKVATSNRRTPAPDTVSEFIKWFCTTPANKLYKVKRGQWSCSLEAGVWQLTFDTDDKHETRNGAPGRILAFRPLGKADMVMMNGGRLSYGGGSRWGVSYPQRLAMDTTAMPIPLRLIMDKKPAGLEKKLEDVKVVEWTGQEEITVMVDSNRRNYDKHNWLEKRHFAGGAVIAIGDEYFLLDADRQELANFKLNAFFTKLPGAVKTIKEAYESLIPAAVKGTTFIRQGELFFKPENEDVIKARMREGASEEGKRTFDNTYGMLMSLATPVAASQLATVLRNDWEDIQKAKGKDPIIDGDAVILDRLTKLYKSPQPQNQRDESTQLATIVNPVGFAGTYKLQVERNIELGLRPGQERNRWGERHHVTLLFMPKPDELYAYGTVTHQQHYPVSLKQWHRVYHNAATGSWNITGEVD